MSADQGCAGHFFHVLSGAGILRAGETVYHLEAGSVALVSPGEVHRFENPTHAEFSILECWMLPPSETVWIDEGDI